MLCGWISVATFVNLSVTALSTAFNPLMLSEKSQAVIVIVTAGITAIWFAYYFKNLFYNACVLWGFVAIYIANTTVDQLIANVALVMGCLGFLTAVLRHFLSLEHRLFKRQYS